MNEEQKENDNLINNFKSLAPNDNADDIDIYKPYIDKILKDSNNKNIAISGRYGAGKSSIIKTYFKDKKVIYVSLASYIEKNQSEEIPNNGKNLTEKNKMKRIIVDQIETSILQQILYKERPHKLPYSRINRIDKESYYIKPINFIISFILTLFFCLSFIMINYNDIKRITDNIPKKVILCLTLSSMFIIILLLVNYISKLGIKKVSINGVELSKEESDISILNRNIDELIHFFMQTNYKYVVFEDIDRLSNCTLIFSKLKEINSILNNALENENKQVVFIYAVGDTVFSTAEERTKFFDAIIPIVPFSGIKSSRDIFFNKYENLNLDQDIVKSISQYIENPRIAYDIINEYLIYCEIFKENNNQGKIEESDKKIILTLAAYKVLYPTRFELLMQNKGKIAYYLSSDIMEDYNKNNSIDEDEKIKFIKDFFNNYKNKNINFCDAFISNSIKKINEYCQKKSYGFNLSYDILLPENLTLKKNSKDKPKEYLNEMLDNVINQVHKKTIISTEDLMVLIKKDEIFNIVEHVDCKINDTITDIIKKLEKKKIEFNMLNQKKSNIIDYLNENDYDETSIYSIDDNKNYEDITKLNNFEKWMIETNNINRNYRKYVIRNDVLLNNIEDEILLERILADDKTIKFNENINNVKSLIEELSIYDFIKDSVCIEEIFDYIVHDLNKEEQEKYLNYFFQKLSIKKTNFIADYIITKNTNELVFQKYINDIINFCEKSPIYDRLESLNYLKEKIYCYAVYCIDYLNDELKPLVGLFFETVPNVEKVFIDNLTLLRRNFHKLDIEFLQQEFSQDEKYNPFYEYVYTYLMYKSNIHLMIVLNEKGHINFDKNRIITSIIKNHLYDKNKMAISVRDAKNLLTIVDFFNKSQEDDEVTLREFVEKYNLYTNEEHLFSLIKKERIKFKDISWINSTLYDDLLKNNQVYANWNNIYLLYDSDYTSNPEMLNKFVKDNIVFLSEQKIDPEYFDMLNVFIQNKTIEGYVLDKNMKRIIKIEK